MPQLEVPPAPRWLVLSSLALAAADPLLFGALISHDLPLSKGVEAYRRFADREEGWTKVVLVP